MSSRARKTQTAVIDSRAETPIDISQINLGELPAKEFPAGPGYRVLIAATAHEYIWKHATRSLDEARAEEREIREVGGILIGSVYKDEDGPYLEISAGIEGECTENQGTQMTFTPSTWVHVTEIKDREYPQEKIVGWYHTHPDFGIFLSEVDKFTQSQFFSPPWTTAFVVDPVQKSEGFFLWSGGQPLQVSEYWVGRQRRESVVAVRPELVRRQPEERLKEPAVSRATFAVAAALGFLALLFVFGYVYVREVAHAENEKLVVEEMEEQKMALAESVNQLAILRRQLESSQKQNSDTAAVTGREIQTIFIRLNNIGRSMTALQQEVTGNEQILNQLRSVVSPQYIGPAPVGAPPPAAGKGPGPASGAPAAAPPKTQSPAPQGRVNKP